MAVATVKRGGGGDVPHCVLSRCASINGTARRVAASSAAASIGRSTGCNAVARPDCGLLYVFLAAFGRLVGKMLLHGRRPKKEGEEGHGSPIQSGKMPCCGVILEAANESPQFQSARPPLSTTPYRLIACRRLPPYRLAPSPPFFAKRNDRLSSVRITHQISSEHARAPTQRKLTQPGQGSTHREVVLTRSANKSRMACSGPHASSMDWLNRAGTFS